MKNLIINADDFGLSKVFNKHIISLIEEWYISSTTVMVLKIDVNDQQEDIQQLLKLNKQKEISIWLHLDFEDGKIELTKENIEKQHKLFKIIFWVEPSHIDVHKFMQYANSDLDILLIEYAKEHNLPLRNRWRIDTNNSTTTKKPAFHATRKSYEEVIEFINTLDNERWEVLIHPWEHDPKCTSSLNEERIGDVELAKKLKPYLDNNWIKLRSFNDLRN
jgi:predicted glycoside hydrolase/deacetylase ChbG (UPF0249 family)